MAATIIIIAVLAVIVFFAVRSSTKHFKGDGGCCGGGSGSIEDEKTLEGKKLGEKIVHIEGMHCDNCKNKAQRALNTIDGASAKVNLGKKQAVVSYDRDLDDEEIRRVIENVDFTVTEIKDRRKA